ncbi:MAG: 5-formyltetrahydrofolate cyclo-ligase [Betaproteobacteria bacterium]|nr:MAG: 5-formyltetrahydrofolate cyclo-ligase [Betaproteobacteria bacterium]
MTHDRVVATKKATRRRVLALRDALTSEERNSKSTAINERLLALPAFADAETVAAYASFATEFDTGPFLKQVLARNKRLVLPRVDRDSKRIQFHFVCNLDGALVPGPWGIREPDPTQCGVADTGEIDFMLVPGVAFTPGCARLGYGGGFYDAAIEETRTDCAKIAAAFAVQIVKDLPLEAHDQKVDLVITEDGEYARPVTGD